MDELWWTGPQSGLPALHPKKDELFTLSYRFSNSPDDNESKTHLENVINYKDSVDYPRWNDNDAYTNEHTVQLDYTTPTWKDQTLEAGLKYIMRQSNSDTKEQIYDYTINNWRDTTRGIRDFSHTQHIYSAYLAYAVKFNKLGFKAGVRAEGTALNAKSKDTPEANFTNDFFDVVPNATLSYQINMAQQMRLGYNMRIYRPGIWYLNPYVNTTDPQNISWGNPNLRSEKSHSLNLNYSLFTQKFNFNANATYRFVNNSIESYSVMNEDAGRMETTYGNIGKNQSIGLFVWGRWNPVPLFNISANIGGNYTDIDANNGMANSGWTGQFFGNAQFRLPKDFSIDLNGGYLSGWIQLQGKNNSYSFNSISLTKAFMDKKLNVSLVCQNPFEKHLKFESSINGEAFSQRSLNYMEMRSFRIRVSYRFGSLKESIKKVRRGINNDDVKSGGSSGSGGGQEGM
nr:outer membrane beta-barrel family protein [Parabacteroides sp. PF5-9]